jgi:Fe-S cluster assembly protein SufD
MHSSPSFTRLQEAIEEHLKELTGTYCWEKIQQEAYKQFQKLGLPSAKTEAYKYTPITSALSKEFAFSKSSGHVALEIEGTAVDTYIQSLIQKQPLDSYSLVLVNGRIINKYLHTNLSPLGIQVLSFEQAYEVHQDLFTRHFNKYLTDHLDIFAILNTAIFNNGIFIYIPDNIAVDKPIWIYNITDSSIQQEINYPRRLIYVGKNSNVSLVNSWHALGSHNQFTNSVTDILVGDHTYLDYYTLQTQLNKAHQINNTHYYQASHSIVNNYTFTWNSLLVRNNLHLHLQASHTKANMYGMYCIKETQHVDNHTTVDHQQPHTESNELYKGILAEKAIGVFNGKIFVRSNAQKTNAFQANNNILLSDEATIYTKPQLEIWADDVKCSHGATIGQLDEHQLFYLQTRGIPEKLARHMLLYAFVDEVIHKIPLLALKGYLQESLQDYLDKLI